jgi:hypothetical protein
VVSLELLPGGLVDRGEDRDSVKLSEELEVSFCWRRLG